MSNRSEPVGKNALNALQNRQWLYLLSIYNILFFILTMAADAQTFVAPVPSKSDRAKTRESMGTRLDSLSGTQLLKESQNVDDTVEKYVLLQEAGKKFVKKNNVKRAMQTIDAMFQTFLINESKIKRKVLVKICDVCSDKDRIPLREISTQATKLAADSVDKNNFTLAVEFYDLAIKAATKESNKPLTRRIEEKRTIAKARGNLKKQPKDPANNRIVGEYFCFEQDAWEKGLPYLANGDDKHLAELASLELQNRAITNQQAIAHLTEAADGWLKASTNLKRKKNQRDSLRTHAESIYAVVLTLLADRAKKVEIIEILEGTKDQNYILRHPLLRVSVKNDPEKAASESAVEAALRWLANHQNRDGSWSFDHTPDDKCSGFANPGDGISPGSSPKVGATGMALLPFLAAGYTHKSAEHNQYPDVVKNGLNFLSKRMDRSSGKIYDSKYWHYHMYSHGIAACALVEAYGMTNDAKLKLPAQKAINYIAASQKPQTGGWHYTPTYNGPGDTSVVCWQIMALKSAVMAYLDVPGHVKTQANKWLDSVGFDKSENGDGFSRYGYMEPSARAHVVNNDGAMTALGLLCRTYLGTKKDAPGQRKGVQWLATMGPANDNVYLNYHATMAIFQNDGPDGQLWKNWGSEMQNMLMNSQVRQGRDTGSWYYGGNHGHTGGRLMSTCLATLMLQSEYRYPLIK